jgi:putative membrane protein
MKKKILLVLMIPVLYFIQSCDDPRKAKNYNQETSVDQGGLNFIDNAMDGGRTEIKLSTVAQRVSQNPRVLSFAKMMVSDHTQAIEGLKKLQKKELVDPDNAISDSHKKMIDSISKLSGSEFDKAYMKQMVMDHEQAVDLFKEGSQDRDNAVQSYAEKTLPTIQMHLDSAKAIKASLL